MNKELYMKLLNIQKGVDKFLHDQTGQNYRYTSGNTVLSKIRPLMNEYKLILKQEVLSIENTRMDYQTRAGANKSEVLSKVIMKFTWVDCETGQTDENLFGANGLNDWDKGFGSALTYGERYFLLKFFHVPSDEDDPDSLKKEAAQPAKLQTVTPTTPIITPKTLPWLNKGTKEFDTCKKIIQDATDKQAAFKALRLTYSISKEVATLLAQ